MTEPLYLLLSLGVIVSYVLLTSRPVVRPRAEEIEEAVRRGAEEIDAIAERGRRRIDDIFRR